MYFISFSPSPFHSIFNFYLLSYSAYLHFCRLNPSPKAAHTEIQTDLVNSKHKISSFGIDKTARILVL